MICKSFGLYSFEYSSKTVYLMLKWKTLFFCKYAIIPNLMPATCAKKADRQGNVYQCVTSFNNTS